MNNKTSRDTNQHSDNEVCLTTTASALTASTCTLSEISSESMHAHSPTSSAKRCVDELTQYDVLLGRGGNIYKYCGNVNFRALVDQYKVTYLTSPKFKKPTIMQTVLDKWRSYGGRFLSCENSARKSKQPIKVAEVDWFEVNEAITQQKVTQSLRERSSHTTKYQFKPVEKTKVSHHFDLSVKDAVVSTSYHLKSNTFGVKDNYHNDTDASELLYGGCGNGMVNDIQQGQYLSLQPFSCTTDAKDFARSQRYAAMYARLQSLKKQQQELLQQLSRNPIESGSYDNTGNLHEVMLPSVQPANDTQNQAYETVPLSPNYDEEAIGVVEDLDILNNLFK